MKTGLGCGKRSDKEKKHANYITIIDTLAQSKQYKEYAVCLTSTQAQAIIDAAQAMAIL